MAKKFNLPELGEGIDSGKVLEILVAEGDTIHPGDPVVEIESDKATAEVPAEEGGVITQIHVSSGDTVSVGDLLLSLEEEQQPTENGGSGKAGKKDKQEKKEGTESSGKKKGSKDKKQNQGEKVKSSSETVEFKLPALGENVDEAQVVSVTVKQGDSVREGDTLLEMETGKATVEVPAEHDGAIKKIHVKEGENVGVGEVIFTIATESSTGDEEAEEESTGDKSKGKQEDGSGSGTDKEEDKKDKPESKEAAYPGAVMATPSVRRLARELGINIHFVKGTGPGGRIGEEDVKRTARQIIITGNTESRRGVAPIAGEALPYDRFGPVAQEEMNGVRRATATHMSRCWSEIPHVTNFDRADFTAIEDARKRLSNEGKKVSLTAILVKIIGLGLKAHPIINATIDMQRQTYTLRKYINIGVAVDTPRGLLVPVVRHADRHSITDIHSSLADLADRARNGKLRREEMEGAGFTLSNLGGLGGGHFTPIVSVPQVGILGVGMAKTEPVWKDGEFVPRSICPLSLSYDHRLVDGADGTRFLRWLVDALENPLLTLLEESGAD